MTPKQFAIIARRLKGLVAFHKIRTVGEALRELGNIELEEFSDPSAPLDLTKLSRLLYLAEHPPKNVLYHKESTFWLPAIHDSLIESLYSPPPPIYLNSFTYPAFNPKQKCLFGDYNGINLDFQLRAAKELYYNLFGPSNHRANLFRGNTGDGKTFSLGQVVRWVIDSGWLKGKSASPFKIVYVTAASVVDQTKEVLRDWFGLEVPRDLTVTNYDALRSSFGEQMLEEKTIVREGYEHTLYEFKDYVHPIVFISDESQKLKNEGSKQAKIFRGAARLKDENVKFIFASATPFSRIYSAAYFAIATRKLVDMWGDSKVALTEAYWPTYAKVIASPGDPKEYTKVNIKRFIKEFDEYIVTFKHVRKKFKPINNILLVDFETKEDAEKYQKAWDRYLEERAKILGEDSKYSNFLILVQFLKFRQAAEILRSRMGARLMWESHQRGYAPVWACNFKPTIAKIVMYLNQDYGVDRKKISLIWGGSSAWAGEKELYTTEEIMEVMEKCMTGQHVEKKVLREIRIQMQQKANDLLDIPEELRLGIQSKDDRWNEIKKFQSGRSEYCLFTFPSGGAGLSLHHNRPELRQRRTFLAPTYNEMEMMQGLGRTDRITSLTSTEQSILLYRGTIEQKVLYTMNTKRVALEGIMKHGAGDIYEDEEAKKLLDTLNKDAADQKDFDTNEDEDEGEDDWKEGEE